MSSSPDQSASFDRRWIVRVTAGETLGFAVATAVAVAMILASAPVAVAVPATIIGGGVEGAILGLFQWSAMRTNRPTRWLWVGATSGAAAIAWTLGLIPSTFGLDLSRPVTIVAVAGGGVLLLASIPLAQALVLRREGSIKWLLINMGAWAVAILWTLVPSPFIDEQTPVSVVVALYVVAGVLMAATVALLTLPVARGLFGRSVPPGRHLSKYAQLATSRPSGPVD